MLQYTKEPIKGDPGVSKKIVILTVIFCAAFAGCLFGQEKPATEETAFEDWMDYKVTFGEVKVVGMAEKTVTIVDQGIEPPENVMVYYLAPEIEVEGAKSAEDIAVGDMVDIEYYVTEDGKRMADFIVVEKKEEDMPLNGEGLISQEEEEE